MRIFGACEVLWIGREFLLVRGGMTVSRQTQATVFTALARRFSERRILIPCDA